MTILKEGGNVFKTAEGPLTTRIATPMVDPTIKFIEKITGLTFDEQELLGTTGKKNDPDGSFEDNSSGDIDLNTDSNKISKEELITRLKKYLASIGVPEEDMMNVGRKKTDGWIKDAGDQVHFRTPIKGSGDKFVQTDFMMTANPDFQRGAKRGGTKLYSGTDRALMLASVARARGFKMSPKFGLLNPEDDSVVSNDWNKIAELLLGKGATEKDTHTVESMLAFLKKDPAYEQLIAKFKEYLEKGGKKLPEADLYRTLEDKQLARIKELSGNMLNSVKML